MKKTLGVQVGHEGIPFHDLLRQECEPLVEA